MCFSSSTRYALYDSTTGSPRKTHVKTSMSSLTWILEYISSTSALDFRDPLYQCVAFHIYTMQQQRMPNWRTFNQFLGNLAYKSKLGGHCFSVSFYNTTRISKLGEWERRGYCVHAQILLSCARHTRNSTALPSDASGAHQRSAQETPDTPRIGSRQINFAGDRYKKRKDYIGIENRAMFLICVLIPSIKIIICLPDWDTMA